jgi:ribosome biogenesis GTPase / thiamine phosphate phosphatase
MKTFDGFDTTDPAVNSPAASDAGSVAAESSATLESWGWDGSWAGAFAPSSAAGLAAARVIAQHRGRWLLAGETGEWPGVVTGKFRHEAALGELPAVGDWVGCLPPSRGVAQIDIVLPRRSSLSRRAAGSRIMVQVVAANVDVLFVATSLNGDLNPRRLERYVAMGKESGSETVILLTKSDLGESAEGGAEAGGAETLAGQLGVAVVAVSGRTGQGLDSIAPWLGAGRTVALVGSSGVGKSTLLNRLAGRELMVTQEIREADSRGRHTTTHRELFRLPGGALLLDTPGMRELGLWDAEEGVDETFADIAELAESCRFADCSHRFEPGCSVLAAVGRGQLDMDRVRSYRRLAHEVIDLPSTAAVKRERDRRFHKSVRNAAAESIARKAFKDGNY